jgi:hypothetical protein
MTEIRVQIRTKNFKVTELTLSLNRGKSISKGASQMYAKRREKCKKDWNEWRTSELLNP